MLIWDYLMLISFLWLQSSSDSPQILQLWKSVSETLFSEHKTYISEYQPADLPLKIFLKLSVHNQHAFCEFCYILKYHQNKPVQND